MKLKLDANGNVVLQDGKPVYVNDDGKEIAFDAPATIATISRLNGEAKTNRERAEAAEGKLKAFDGITDPAAALKALGIVKNLDDKKLVDAGEVERVKSEVQKALEQQYAPVVKRAEDLEAELYAERIGGAFARSPLIVGEKATFAIPADMVQARFGKHFKIEDGKTVAYDANGNKIFSLSRPGELADFDEALKVLVDQYPYKAQILKGSGATGGGAGGGGGHGGGKTTYTREQFAKLGPAEQSDVAAKVRKGEAALAD